MVDHVTEVLSTLHKTNPNLKYYLTYSNPLELLVAAMLSAQVRDEVVNATTPALFQKYRTTQDYASADVEDIVQLIKNISFAGNKAKNIKAACSLLVEKHRGEVPATMDDLTALPGIGRKTAHVILQNVFNKVEGIVVDTHVLRVAYRLGWTSTDKNAEKSEAQLMSAVPRDEWKELPFLLKAHGRTICTAPIPTCSQCPVQTMCPKNGVKKFV